MARVALDVFAWVLIAVVCVLTGLVLLAVVVALWQAMPVVGVFAGLLVCAVLGTVFAGLRR